MLEMELEISHLYETMLFVFASFMPVLNPFGGAMFFLALTAGADTKVRSSLSLRIGIYSAFVLLISIFAGNLILNFFGISLGVLRVAGGIVLFSAGWHALNAPPSDEAEQPRSIKTVSALKSMAFYPFTLPLTTGPGAISVAVALGATPPRDAGDIGGIILGTLLSCILVWLTYRFSDRLGRSVGTAGADALSRIFSFILICLGVAIFWSGFSELYATLPRS